MSHILAIDVGTSKVCALIAQIGADKSARIVGSGICKSQGLVKGVITDIAKAAAAIKTATDEARQHAGVSISRAIVSVSGAYAKSVQSSGKANIPLKDIEFKDVNRVMRLALESAAAPSPPDEEILHVFPYSFKVDDQSYVEDPVGMSGSRLETQVNIILAKKTALDNLRKAIAGAGIEIGALALSGYVASIAVLNEDEKKLGACVIDIGAASFNLVVYQGNAPRHCDFFAVGGGHITSDLAISLHTPQRAAEEIKIQYGRLNGKDNGSIEIPEIGNENAVRRSVSWETIANVIGARMEETVLIQNGLLIKSHLKSDAAAGVVFTGGASKLVGLSEMAEPIFGNIPIRIAYPKALAGMADSLRDPTYSVAIGLIRYGAGEFTPYEIDSNNVLKGNPRGGAQKPIEQGEEIDQGETKIKSPEVDFPPDGISEPTFLKRFWNWLSQIF
ncbi:MAG: cell division protein FtsA [Helicobacteraceae bacterium]|jgi:cell division protein FtsA|nr:cell division protein FtsA [Helicobacteraceae bacterium]